MSISRRNFIIRTGLLLPACAYISSAEIIAANRSWRRGWDGQLPLNRLPYDEALELIYDSSLPVNLQPLKRPAAARVHRECEALILEFKAILKKAKGNLAPYQKRIYEISVLVPAGFNALVVWGNRDNATRQESMLLITDLLNTLAK